MAAELEDLELYKEAVTWPNKAKAIAITDQISYDRAADLLIIIAELEKRVIDHHADPKKKSYDAWKSICAAEKSALDPLTEAKGIIKRSLGIFVQEQERIRIEAQRKADEEARKREEEARLALAVQAEEMGATEETIQEIVETPMPIQRPVVVPSFQKAAVISASHKPVYRWRVTNEKLIPREYLKINEVALNAAVRIPGIKIAGIEIYEDIPNISVRGRR